MISVRLRVVAVFLLFCAFVLVISTPTPKDVELSKRSTGDDVLSILASVKLVTDTVLPQIDNLVASGTISDATLRPLLSQLASTVSTALKSLSSLQHPITFPAGAATQASIISLTTQIVSAVAKSGVGVILVIPNVFSTAVFLVTSILQDMTGITISLPGLPPISIPLL